MSTQSEDPARVRTSDAEREQVATVLRAAVSEGRLRLEEGDERLARAYQATYRDELDPLTADLPGGGWDALHRTPEALAAIRRRIRLHGVGVLVVAAVLVGLWVVSGAHFFWPLFPVAFLTFSFLRHRRFARYARSGWGRGPWGGPGRGPWDGPWGHGPWGAQAGRGPWGGR
ncbi:hypothetical protein GCM10023322_49230 [Rugosimonospora acidiphila]|uniref:DUF1707 domain-containing protein n=1 Tax=Rugosimonospora acidiphila TaxID=556531 RepID=A0ABP9S7H6_9ACTN